GKVPPAPEEIQGEDLKLRFISPLAKAQEASKVSSIERVWNFAGTLAQLGKPEGLQKLDAVKSVEEFADAVGAP
ncbi:MAG: phage tail protein, partial [Anaerolineae bacterium]|nr:phage tail protein [Anaerolineae bacterium]